MIDLNVLGAYVVPELFIKVSVACVSRLSTTTL